MRLTYEDRFDMIYEMKKCAIILRNKVEDTKTYIGCFEHLSELCSGWSDSDYHVQMICEFDL